MTTIITGVKIFSRAFFSCKNSCKSDRLNKRLTSLASRFPSSDDPQQLAEQPLSRQGVDTGRTLPETFTVTVSPSDLPAESLFHQQGVAQPLAQNLVTGQLDTGSNSPSDSLRSLPSFSLNCDS